VIIIYYINFFLKAITKYSSQLADTPTTPGKQVQYVHQII